MPTDLVVFYHPDCDFRFADYGIEIPVVPDRASTVFSHLKIQNPNLSYFDPQKIPEISKDDLLLAHNKDFVDRLFGSYQQLEREMMTCYELVNAEGIYHRYNPKNAKNDFTHAFNIILKQTGRT